MQLTQETKTDVVFITKLELTTAARQAWPVKTASSADPDGTKTSPKQLASAFFD